MSQNGNIRWISSAPLGLTQKQKVNIIHKALDMSHIEPRDLLEDAISFKRIDPKKYQDKH